MGTAIPHSRFRDSLSFQNVAEAFLAGDGLPFAEILSAERIERIFVKHGCLFGLHGVYTTSIMVWSFLSQVQRDCKEASCQFSRRMRRQLLRATGAPIADRRYRRLLSSTSQTLRSSTA